MGRAESGECCDVVEGEVDVKEVEIVDEMDAAR